MHEGVAADEEDVAFVAHADRLRRVRQGDGVVAARVAEDLAAVATVMLKKKHAVSQTHKSRGFPSVSLMSV